MTSIALCTIIIDVRTKCKALNAIHRKELITMLEAFADFVVNIQTISAGASITQLAADLELYGLADILANM